MKPYALMMGRISQEQYAMFLEMRTIFEQLPDFEFASPVSCHVICRAFAENYPVECVDGHFSRNCDHSWLVLDSHTMEIHGDTDSVIADMYPMGGVTPFLVHDYFKLPWRELYIPDDTVTKGFRDTEEFLNQVSVIAMAINDLRKNGST